MTRLAIRAAGTDRGIGLAAPLARPAEAQTTKIKLVLNWKYQGPQGMFFLADDKGYFKAEGPRSHARPGQRLGRRGAAGCQRHL